MRIIFIPGLGEDEFIFDKIAGELPGDKLVLSLWKLLPNHRVPGLNVSAFARSLVQQYQITPNDLVIGHSTGGWVALYIKQAVSCPIIQLASWTDRKKVIVPVSNRHIIYFAVRSGLYLNSFVLKQSVNRFYRDKPSRQVFEQVFKRLISGNRANAVNQLQLIFNPVPEQAALAPDLCIHAKADRIVRFPDEPVLEVPGDHFSLYTHPEAVVAPIRQFINKVYGHS